MHFVEQTGSAILETDRPVTPLELERVKAELQSIGISAVILPMGMRVASMAECSLEDDE